MNFARIAKIVTVVALSIALVIGAVPIVGALAHVGFAPSPSTPVETGTSGIEMPPVSGEELPPANTAFASTSGAAAHPPTDPTPAGAISATAPAAPNPSPNAPAPPPPPAPAPTPAAPAAPQQLTPGQQRLLNELARRLQDQPQYIQQFARECTQASMGGATITDCIYIALYILTRSWALKLSDFAATLANMLAILDILLLAYALIINRRTEPHRFLIKLAGKFVLLAIVLAAINNYGIFFRVPADIARGILAPLMTPDTDPNTVDVPIQSLFRSPLAEQTLSQYGVVAQADVFIRAGFRIISATFDRVSVLDAVTNPVLVLVPVVGLIAAILVLLPVISMVFVAFELYFFMIIGTVLLALSLFRGTRMMTGAFFTTLTDATIRFIFTVLFAAFALVVAQFSATLIELANESARFAFDAQESLLGGVVAGGGSLLATLYAVTFMLLITAAASVALPRRISQTITREMRWNLRDILEPD